MEKRESSALRGPTGSCQSNAVTPGHAPSRTNGRGPAGNLTAALSRTHPARPDQQTPPLASHMSELEAGQQHSSLDLHQAKFCGHQTSAGKDQRPLGEGQSPENDGKPLGKDQTAARKDYRPPRTDQKPSKKQQIAQSSEDNDQTSVIKHHRPSGKDQRSGKKDQRPAEKDQSTATKKQTPAKDHSPMKKAERTEADKKDHSPPDEDHSPPEKDKKDHSPANKVQKLAEKDNEKLTPAEKGQKNIIPANKYQSPSEKVHSPAKKDQRTVEKQQKTSNQDKNPEEDKKDSSEKHNKHQLPAELDQKDQLPVELDHKDQSSAEIPQMKKKLEDRGISEHRKSQNRLTVDSTSSKSGKPAQEDPPPAKPDLTGVDPCCSQQQIRESSSLTKTPLSKEQPDLLKPGPLCTDRQMCQAFPQPKQGSDQQPSQDLGPDTKPELQQSLKPEQKPHEEVQHQAEEPAEHCQTQNQQKPPFKNQSVEKSPGPGLSHEKPLPDGTQQSLLAPSPKDSNLALAPAITIELLGDPVPPKPSLSEPKLCGFLQKQGGPLRAWKQRWFTYEDKKNQLFYYRTPQDVMPLGRVELRGATFTYPLKAEKGTFHIKTPERTFILRAMSQDLMLYWLQQLQIKRWHHRQNQTCTDPTTNNNGAAACADDFLPVLKSPIGLVGEEAANSPAQRTPLANMSIKHPLIELQNSVHSLRKRSSQELSQSIFHVEAQPRVEPGTAETASPAASQLRRLSEPPTPTAVPPPADPAGHLSPLEDREPTSLLDSYRRKMKTPSSSTMSMRRKDSDRTTRLLQDNRMLTEEVKAQKELVWILHKALEASQLEKRTCAEFLSVDGEKERLELLRHRERQTADLKGKLEEAEATAEAAKKNVASREAQVSELQENIRMLTEKNNAKQEVIIKLSDQMTSYLSKPQQSCSPSCRDAQDSVALKQLQQELENLKDDIEAYKIQNKFLNSEIYQLTKLWRTSSQQEKSLMVKCAHLEATNCQVESRYLGVLRQLQDTKSLDPVQREAVQKMIEDALKGQLTSVLKLNSNRDYDEYGFKIVPDYEVEDMKLLAKIQALEIRSHNLLHQEAVERPLLSRWAQYLAGRSDEDLCSSPELKVLVRGGIPPEYRPRVWRWIIQARTRTIQDHHPQHYQQLCEKSRTSPHPVSRQIQLDLHRTLTTNQNFSPSSPTLQQLRRILLAFSWHNPAIGYCQGLNRLAAMALLVLQKEEDAFWCLVAVVESIMPEEYYTKNLVASQTDQRVLKDFMMEKLPRLAAHFEEKNIDVSLVTFNWFLVVFVESLPSDLLLPLWDAFLYEGTKVMFRYALALFKYKEEDILKISDSVEIYQYLRFFTKTICDSRKLTSIAFGDMNPFPRRLLRNRRTLHLERLQGELRELEEQQKAFLTESAEHKDKDVDTVASEDDDDL